MGETHRLGACELQMQMILYDIGNIYIYIIYLYIYISIYICVFFYMPN